METYINSENVPETPAQLLTLFANTSTSIDRFSDGVIQSVKQGEISPLAVCVQLKAMELASERIRKEIRPELLTEVDKYPEKKFSFQGNEITKAEHGTKYDFTVCNDPVWNDLKIQFEALSLVKAKREEWLKTMAGKETIIVGDEIVDIFPPMKRSSSGINISIR